MTLKPRYLTKSLFTLACECPTKLYYTKKKDEYSNTKLEDSFLKALAEGGLQIGALAKLYYGEGQDITAVDPKEALAQTSKYLNQENITLFEAAIKHNNLFIRADILVKQGNSVELIEVKAKSYDKNKTPSFLTKTGGIKADWRPYLQDIAFQTFVFGKSFPDLHVTPYLLLADKQAKCPTDGLYQKFLLKRGNGDRKVKVETSSLTREEMTEKILIKVPVQEAVQVILNNEDQNLAQTFPETVEQFSTAYKNNHRLWSELGTKCAKCEFKVTDKEETQGLKSGFQECWSHHLNWTKADFDEPTILELWNYRSKDKLIAEGIYRLSDIPEEMLATKKDDKPGMSTSQRQRLQLFKVQTQDNKPKIDLQGLQAEISKLTFPLHFIDFETIQSAIPFHMGRRPYEPIAFQFSHHQMESDGTVKHQGEYLNTEKDFFPNYEFTRQLKTQLTKDNGSIFRYSHHENTYLNHIYKQLEAEPSPPKDHQELKDFIKSISKSSRNRNQKDSWEGERNMIDLLEWVKSYYYDPYTKGSNSIKQVLPAILNSSAYLQRRYSQKNYGKNNEIQGSNFQDFQWVQRINNQIQDPYKLLPKLFLDVSDKDMVLLTQENELNNGTAALTAYARMQFTQMSNSERNMLETGLLQYCELDTLAMVMIFEGWLNWELS
ncbi:protein of unknown function(DUF2779) [Xenococcus sp. PCC 7305]|uniref:DUF2779 domain-containing protein n=1 Tax=Xenococcus sp. PCC 7305 TaxID=102125 RepID=UPI0002AC1EDE|nr:DUF2779 domain-containing protein [Xenococcus sp. PCC 7305]ELS05413.1 protein of unknown function(DUF2779) [Xenococcus sp. PCC 7305]